MPKYIYTVKSGPHKIIRGIIEAESKQDAVNKLIALGYCPVAVDSDSLSFDRNNVPRSRKISRHEIVVFTRQLSSLIESGVNILSGLSIIAGQTTNKQLKAALEDIITRIKDGRALSESLNAHPYLFSGLYTALVRSGEVGGNIEQVLKRLADYLEKEEEFRNSVSMSLAYPIFLLMVSILTIVVLLGFIIPRLVVMFEDMGGVLPLPTRILMDVSGALRNYWWFILLVVGLFVFIWKRLHENTQGKLLFDRVCLRLPLLGNIALKKDIARLMHTLSLLLSSGIAIITALDISMTVMQNTVLKIEIKKFKDKITSGASFSQCLGESLFFPVLVTSIVRVGEEAGNLEKALMRIADDYEKQVDRTLKTMTRLLEPSIILIMGLIVGFIVISMLLPIFQINLTVK